MSQAQLLKQLEAAEREEQVERYALYPSWYKSCNAQLCENNIVQIVTSGLQPWYSCTQIVMLLKARDSTSYVSAQPLCTFDTFPS